MSSLQDQYSAVRYPHYVHALTDPARLAAIGKILGMTPVSLSSARVLEIGCGAGANLLAMAQRMPGNRYLGLDFSSPDIAAAQAVVVEAGLTNIEFIATDLLAWEPGDQKFDYIIAQGFYSWVPDEVKDRLLKVISSCLSPNGIACASYMTYPGCKQPEALRDLMQLRTDALPDPAAKVAGAHAILDFLDRAWQAVPGLPHSSYMRQEVRRIREKEPHFLLHDDLELVRDPVYLLDFTRHAAAHGLKYLGDSEFDSMLLINLPPATAQELMAMRLSPLETEQILDYITNRQLRTTLLAAPTAQIADGLNPTALRDLCFAPRLQPIGDHKPGASEGRFEATDHSKVALRTVPLVAFIRALAARTGSMTPYAELRVRAQQLAGRAFTEEEETHLRGDLLTLYARRELDLSALPFAVPASLPERPSLTRLNRALVKHRGMVVPAFHSSIRLTEQEQAFCLLLDGTRTASQLQQSEQAKSLKEKTDFYLHSLNRIGCLQ